MIETQFIEAIQAAGITPPDKVIPDGEIHRLSTNGKRSDEAGWYVLHIDGIPAGRFGCWRAGIDQAWCSKSKTTMTDAERSAYAKSIKDAKAKRDAEQQRLQAEAANKCQELLNKASERIDHPYVTAKGIRPYGLRQIRKMLLIPMFYDGELVNLQFIGEDGRRHVARVCQKGLVWTA